MATRVIHDARERERRERRFREMCAERGIEIVRDRAAYRVRGPGVDIATNLALLRAEDLALAVVAPGRLFGTVPE